jgi:hypothetical protein
MAKNIQKYHGNDNSDERPRKNIEYNFEEVSFWMKRRRLILLLISVIVCGLGLFATNGLFTNRVSVVVTFGIVVIAIIFAFGKQRKYLNEPEYWIGIAFSIVLFACISLRIFLNTYAEKEKVTEDGKLRAYITCDGPIAHTIQVNKLVKVALLFVVSGETPARHIISQSEIKRGTGVYQPEMDSVRLPQIEGFAASPGQTPQIEATGWVLSASDSSSIVNGTAVLFVYGKVGYITQSGEHHLTNFCFAYRPRDSSWIAYNKYNDAD